MKYTRSYRGVHIVLDQCKDGWWWVAEGYGHGVSATEGGALSDAYDKISESVDGWSNDSEAEEW